jgi:hypothetical protein
MQKRNNEMTKEESSPQPEAVSRIALYVCCTSHGTEMAVQSVHLPSGKLARVRIVTRVLIRLPPPKDIATRADDCAYSRRRNIIATVVTELRQQLATEFCQRQRRVTEFVQR